MSQRPQDLTTHTKPRTQKPVEACVICLEPVSERAIAVPCNHCAFDFLCLVSWLQEHNQCPLCKADITSVEYDYRSPDEYLTYMVQPPAAKLHTSSLATFSNSGSTTHRRPHLVRGRPRPNRRRYETPNPDAAILRRRHVYRNRLFSLHVGSNRLSRFKDFTPADFAKSAELEAKARKWVRRELQVFDFLSADTPSTSTPLSVHQRRRADNAEFLLLYIVSILKTVDIKGSSGKAEELLVSYLGEDNAKLFLHELEAWLRSPYINLEDWDRAVQYQEQLPSFPNIRAQTGGSRAFAR